MLPPPERRWPGVVVRYILFVGVLALAGTPLYRYTEPAHRPGLVRLALASVLGVGLVHLIRTAGARLAAQPPSAFEAALVPERVERRLAPPFVTLRDEVRYSVANQGYFEHVLWPRLLTLRKRASPDRPPDPPGGRRILRRGPSLARLRALIAELEDHA